MHTASSELVTAAWSWSCTSPQMPACNHSPCMHVPSPVNRAIRCLILCCQLIVKTVNQTGVTTGTGMDPAMVAWSQAHPHRRSAPTVATRPSCSSTPRVQPCTQMHHHHTCQDAFSSEAVSNGGSTKVRADAPPEKAGHISSSRDNTHLAEWNIGWAAARALAHSAPLHKAPASVQH
jgi:hypothetical protein